MRSEILQILGKKEHAAGFEGAAIADHIQHGAPGGVVRRIGKGISVVSSEEEEESGDGQENGTEE